MPAIDHSSGNYLNELRNVRAELERRVEQRTAQLAAANEVLKAYNEAGHYPFQLSLSIGAVEIDHTYEFGIEDQMAKAEAKMYRDKRDRRAQSGV